MEKNFSQFVVNFINFLSKKKARIIIFFLSSFIVFSFTGFFSYPWMVHGIYFQKLDFTSVVSYEYSKDSPNPINPICLSKDNGFFLFDFPPNLTVSESNQRIVNSKILMINPASTYSLFNDATYSLELNSNQALVSSALTIDAFELFNLYSSNNQSFEVVGGIPISSKYISSNANFDNDLLIIGYNLELQNLYTSKFIIFNSNDSDYCAGSFNKLDKTQILQEVNLNLSMFLVLYSLFQIIFLFFIFKTYNELNRTLRKISIENGIPFNEFIKIINLDYLYLMIPHYLIVLVMIFLMNLVPLHLNISAIIISLLNTFFWIYKSVNIKKELYE